MLKVIGIALLLISLSFQLLAASAKIYVWRNEQGVLVFSDTARPGAEEIKVNPQNIMISSSINTSMLDITPQKIPDIYDVEISQPKNKATIWDNTGSVYISGLVKPLFKSGLNIQLYLDGKKYQKPQSRAIYILRNIDRGEHNIKLILLNNKGKKIASSKKIIFYMHRTSIN
ncbi:MAG: DUF4124 domain-containing protein [Alteromonadaceae bacterium]|nr:DUF4124 domain-containing protein [Alteromonadaceae bacterium]